MQLGFDFVESSLVLDIKAENTQPFKPYSNFDVIEDSGARPQIEALVDDLVRKLLREDLVSGLQA
jgi:hypothetical protein